MTTKRSLRRYQISGFVALLLLVGGIGGWVFTTSISGAVVVQARVVVESNAKEVQHLEGGIVAVLNVRNGDSVEAGEVLIRLDDTDTKSSLEIINTQLYELLALKARLEAERDGLESIVFPEELTRVSDTEWVARTISGQQKLFSSRRDFQARRVEQLSNRIEQSRQELVGLDMQLASQKKQLALLHEELSGVMELSESGLTTVSRSMGLERQIASLEGELGQMVASVARVESQITESELEIIQIGQDAQTTILEELRDIQPRISELYERRITARAELRRIDIVSPQAGFVHELQVNGPGSVIASGQVIMRIVPGEDTLVLDAQVNPQDIDQISLGQDVIINFPAFAGGVTPSIEGSVYRIAADLTEESNGTPPYYAVRIELRPGEIDKLQGLELKPGMPAEVYIKTGDRSVLSYLLKPFTDQIRRAFRES